MSFTQFTQAKKPVQRKKNIFISYREKDSSGETGRLADALKQYFDADQIFMDIDKIEPGVDFTDVISRSLEDCDVMLAVIGPEWATLQSSKSNLTRINEPNDWVRLEIATALQRNIRVVPVLVNGASLPGSEQLPNDLQALLRRQSYEVSNRRWQYDTENLAAFLEKSVGIPQKNQHRVAPEPQKASSGLVGFIKYGLIGVGALFIILIAYYAINGDNPKPVTPVNNNGPEPISNNGQPVEPVIQNVVPQQQEQALVPADLEGLWYDANGLYYFDIFQSGNQVEVYSYATANGQKTGEGIGTINGRRFSFKINVANFGQLSANTKLAPQGHTLSGTYTIQNNGATYTEPVTLNRRDE